MLTLRQLKYFVAAAELGKVSEAAVQLHISQSAVTTAIKDLEEMFGQSLFDRSVSGVELTPAGRHFLSHAYTVLSAAEEAMRPPPQGIAISGLLSIAATYTVLGYFLPNHLQRFSERYPDIEIKLQELQREAIEDGLVTGRHDLGVLLTGNVTNGEIACETFFGSQRRLWVRAKHLLLDKPEVTLADVAGEPYIMLTVDEAAYSAMRYWGRTEHQPRIRLRTSSVEAVRSMVANGQGVAILSDMVYRPWSLEGKRIETIVLKGTVPSMALGLAWRSGAEFTPAMLAFRNYFRQLYMDPSHALGRQRG
ncbi:LysR family transcriptional regulator [Acidovorax temperans]|uniref:LysR family transcriptional regulator n=1 Tax=Acidovorax temperans TaxID=80878 RepID=A0A543L831_9BURK|nr:LysR family transcriptional regulator [Acidovorax temperans]MBA4059468.1 LysR family transcriptional regulator [Verminephrobacter sp.]TQN03473.1 LysR family transcriptional regulator [Acidovorax temperans]